jgi:hypothetical protein
MVICPVTGGHDGHGDDPYRLSFELYFYFILTILMNEQVLDFLKKKEGDLCKSPEMKDLDYISFNFGSIEGGFCL